MTLSDFVRMVGDFAEITVTILLVYTVYKIATLIDTLDSKIRKEKNP